MEHIRVQEWIAEDEAHGWFNGYYDDHKNPVEGCKDRKVRMMLTSQVFAIMSGTATPDQIRKICQSADKYLYDEKAGGYRLNTDFGEEKMDLGRMFGFAYGEKENGAVFPIWLSCTPMHCTGEDLRGREIKPCRLFLTRQ